MSTKISLLFQCLQHLYLFYFFLQLVYIIIIIDKHCSLSHITETIITIITKGTEMRPAREKAWATYTQKQDYYISL